VALNVHWVGRKKHIQDETGWLKTIKKQQLCLTGSILYQSQFERSVKIMMLYGIIFVDLRRSENMSTGLIKMWFALGAMGLMFLSIVTIMLSRYKLKGVFKWTTAVLAYTMMIIAGIVIFFVVFTGPVIE
jgi:hypothetical protein